MINALDKCVGCGEPTNGYEFVGIGAAQNPEVPANAHGFKAEAFPICRKCHHEPPRPLKLHYCLRSEVAKYLQRAGSPNLGG